MKPLLTALLSFVQYFFQMVPERFLVWLCRVLVKFFLFIRPSLTQVSQTNLAIAFPEKTPGEREAIFLKYQDELTTVLTQMLQMPFIDPEWVKHHVTIRKPELFEKAIQTQGVTGCIFATAHLGNFELLLHAIVLKGGALHFISRALKSQVVNEWWTARRMKTGGVAIDREGGMKASLSVLKQKKILAVLFDQNVTRNHAAFIPFFGKLAATTKLIPLCLSRYQVPLFFVTIVKVADLFEIVIEEIPYRDLLSLDTNTFTDEVLKRLHAELESRIKEYPHGWFWFHRRWKTTVQPGDVSVYDATQ